MLADKEEELKYQALRNRAYSEAGLILAGNDDDGDEEWIGTQNQWGKANLLLEKYSYE